MNSNIKRNAWNHQVLFPFGFNISQKNATEKALRNNASIIEGPPGTGKTQTILNIIAKKRRINGQQIKYKKYSLVI